MAHPSVDCPHFHSPHGDHSLFIVQMKALIIKREPSDDQQSTFFPPYMAIYYYSRYIQVHATIGFSTKVRLEPTTLCCTSNRNSFKPDIGLMVHQAWLYERLVNQDCCMYPFGTEKGLDTRTISKLWIDNFIIIT